jgi:SAM-dependent methyltransferase
MSKSALAGVSRFNQSILRADVMNLPAEHPELVNRFDFANLWGVAMCTHDPLKAFLSAGAMVKEGGALYLMVYAPEGMHNRSITNLRRRQFFHLPTLQEKLRYADRVYHRRWDPSSPVKENVKNVMRNLMRRPKGSKVGVLDMLEPCYNWVIPFEVIEGWAHKGAFSKMFLLNELDGGKCAYHVLMLKSPQR